MLEKFKAPSAWNNLMDSERSPYLFYLKMLCLLIKSDPVALACQSHSLPMLQICYHAKDKCCFYNAS